MSVSDGGQGLRVALLGTRGIPAAYGGFETFAEQLSIRLVQHGYSVTVYAEADEECIPEDSTYQGVTIRYRRRPSWGPGSVVAYDCACLWDARRNFDVVYMLGYGAARFGAEYFREPDAHLGLLTLGLSMGQWLCVPMIAVGALIWGVAQKKAPRPGGQGA